MNSAIKIVVDRRELLEKLIANKEKHIIEYKESLRGYRVACVEFFEEQLALAKEGKDFRTSFVASKPTKYTDEYDLAIVLAQYHTGDTLELDVNDARCFLDDKWNWTQSFSSSNMYYTPFKTGSLGASGLSGFSGSSITFSDDEL